MPTNGLSSNHAKSVQLTATPSEVPGNPGLSQVPPIPQKVTADAHVRCSEKVLLPFQDSARGQKSVSEQIDPKSSTAAKSIADKF